MASSNIQPKSKVVNSSAFSLDDEAFDLVNWRPAGSPANETLSADTPQGVLAGSVACVDDDYQSSNGLTSSPSLLGLFSDNSEGNPFENAPGPASGVVGIYMCGGLFDVFVFETNAALTAFASILTSYTIGCALYCSLFSLLTNQEPTAVDGGGVNTIVGYCTSVPTSASLKLGIKLIL